MSPGSRGGRESKTRDRRMDPARVPSAPAPPDYRTPCAYVENCISAIMRSERLCGVCGDDATVAAGSGAESPHIILWSADAVQHGDQLVGRSETAGFEHRHRRHGERFKLLCWIRAQIDFRALKTGMAEPEGDLSDVPRRVER